MMVENYRRNIQKIKSETGITVKMLIDVSRTFGTETAEKNLQLLLAYRIPEIIGIGLGGSEQKDPANLFGGVFAKARQNGLVAVAHAGAGRLPRPCFFCAHAFSCMPCRLVGEPIFA